MSSISKRRKVDATTTPRATRSIAVFARTTKGQALVVGKDVLNRNAVADGVVAATVGGKRKIESVETEIDTNEIHVDVEETIREAAAILDAAANTSLPSSQPEETPASEGRQKRAIRPLPRRAGTSIRDLRHPPKTPARQIKKVESPPHTPGSVQTPTNGLRGLLDDFFLPSSQKATTESSPIKVDSPTTKSAHDTDEGAASTAQWPQELTDLQNMHSSFLTALTLHYAHNGTHTPCDIRQLCPNIARCWGKRAVVLNDIKRILGVLNHAPTKSSQAQENPSKTLAKLSLSDYGYSKLCIEIRTVGRLGRMAKPLDEVAMNALFTTHLEALWADADTINIAEFMRSLPVEEVRQCASASKMSPLLAKGQRRLEDLRFGMVVKRQVEEDAKQAKIKQEEDDEKENLEGDKMAVDTPVKKLSLLERLKLKAEEKKNAPPPLSKEELARRAALGRLEEVVAVLTLLSTGTSVGQARVSFTLPTVLGKLKDSFKTPLARSEAETCIRLLSEEVAPEWCRIVKMGRGEAIVLSTEVRPTDETFRLCIKTAMQAPVVEKEE